MSARTLLSNLAKLAATIAPLVMAVTVLAAISGGLGG